MALNYIPLKDKLKEFARSIGVEIVGVADASPFMHLERVLRERERDGHRSPFEEQDIELRCDPGRVMPGTRSIIAVAVPYATPLGAIPSKQEQEPDPGKKEPGRGGEELRGKLKGRISMSAWGKDYHVVVRDILRRLGDFLAQNAPRAVRLASFVDTGPLVDRAIAQRAGTGWYGKNCSIFTQRYGSWVFLGEILTDLELEPDTPSTGPGSPVPATGGRDEHGGYGCGECDICLRACPTGALDPRSPYVTNANICLSYITQMRGFVPRDMRPKMGFRLYGCDTCQEVCPRNKRVAPAGLAAFRPRSWDDVAPDLLDVLAVSNSRFKEAYGLTAAGWRGRTILQRNAVIALGNLMDDHAVDLAIPVLEACLDDPRPVIRGHAAWSLGVIGGARGRRSLEERYRREGDARVRDEIVAALDKCL